MTNTRITIAAGVTIEEVAEDFMVMVPGAIDVLRVSGDAADAIRQIRAGKVIQPSGDTIAHLKDLGVVVDTPGMSRRGLLTVGAAGVGAGISVLALPSVAAASSPGGGGTSGGGASGGAGTSLLGAYEEMSGNSFAFFIGDFTNPNNWPFKTGDTVPALTELTAVASGTSFSGGTVTASPSTVGTVTASPSTVGEIQAASLGPPGTLVARWEVSGGNSTIFNADATAAFAFGGASYTVTFTKQMPPGPL